MKTDQLFYESIYDAMRTVVAALGGPKKVGQMLWPAKSGSDQRVRDCMNETREEKFAPDELLKLARWGKEAGCHALTAHFNSEAGYAAPIPINAEDEQVELRRKSIEAVGYMRGLIERWEKLNGVSR